jgi:hypothetical protein
MKSFKEFDPEYQHLKTQIREELKEMADAEWWNDDDIEPEVWTPEKQMALDISVNEETSGEEDNSLFEEMMDWNG